MSEYNNNINGFGNEQPITDSANEPVSVEPTDTFSSDYQSVSDAKTESVAENNTANPYTENSYEWNPDKTEKSPNSEYHYSYVNGNNQNAAHNPNNYDSAYQTGAQNTNFNSTNTAGNTQQTDYSYQNYNGYSNQNPYGYNNQQYQSSYNTNQPYNAYGANPQQKKVKPKKEKKPPKPVSRGFLAIVIALTIVASAALGFGGGMIASKQNKTVDGSLTINKVEPDKNTESVVPAGSTTSIVQKTADSVVEIATESVVTGTFAQQYVQQGAGSGVIISEDGYIITNHHVIDGANNVTVTLRDGTTSYTAALIGSDKENDIALLKVDATGLKPATFGDSSTLAVGDYVVAIGNPLGELGGTVTDGIISALAREVTIEGQNMTLLQTNAQISPGNSGGGLFNANGELVGIVNAKDSATEVEGIAFAIPVNNVLDIINDLKAYGYVTGKIDLGMQLTDINSNATAFYYGVNQTGCYVLSVTRGSNAETAGFHTGDIITKVDKTEVSSTDEVEKALEKFEVGDVVDFEVYRSGKTIKLKLTLAEYVPSGNISQQETPPVQDYNSIWDEMFGW